MSIDDEQIIEKIAKRLLAKPMKPRVFKSAAKRKKKGGDPTTKKKRRPNSSIT